MRDLAGAGAARAARQHRRGAGRRRGTGLPQSGVTASVRLDAAPLDAWQAALGNAAQPLPAVDGGYLPQHFALRADSLQWGGRQLHALTIDGSREAGTWRAQVDAREPSAARITYHEAEDGEPGSVHARLARLVIAQGAEDEVTTLLDEQPSACRRWTWWSMTSSCAARSWAGWS